MGAGERFDVAVVGGGILGVATAAALVERGRSVVVLEAEALLAAHQSGRNSGVIHSGLYYPPGSLKARLCAEGREALYRFCAEEGVPHRRCGKLVVAADERETARLEELERRGRANGLAGVRRVGADEIRAREPHAAGVAGLLVPETGVVDFGVVTAALARRLLAGGGEVRTGSRVRRIAPAADGLRLETAAGVARCRHLVNCAGLQADRVARSAGLRPRLRILPFRGEYFELREERRDLVRALIYPVPDPRLPFLGVHLTRRVDDRVEAGPNALLAWRREGYAGTWPSPRDAAATLLFPGFWRLARRHWRAGWREARRAGSRQAFARDLRRLVPALRAEDLGASGSGVRAQAVDRDGRLVDDFALLEAPRMTHVLNAPSPAATAALAIAVVIAERADRAMAAG
jgi:(S)-2-hydroxyglutarate dehydrogenase